MSFNPFIHDSTFRGSPILSYGRAPSGTVWPKILAILAGILVVFGLIGLVWFWFFSTVPVPSNSVVRLILPAGKVLNYRTPLEWKRGQELNKPMPVIIGLAQDEQNQDFVAYAIRLSPIEAIFSEKTIWFVDSKIHFKDLEYKSPYMIFGWPWNLLNQEVILDINSQLLFSYKDIVLHNLPGNVSGRLIGNEWQTDLRIFDDMDANDFMINIDENADFAVFNVAESSFLKNYYYYRGINYIQDEDLSLFAWTFLDGDASANILTTNKKINISDSTSTSSTVNIPILRQDFVLPDGDVVKRIYASDREHVQIASSASSNNATGLTEDRMEFMQNNNVSSLTCNGWIMARLNDQSINNLCSWFDICFVDWKQLVFVNRDGYLVVCGY